jgi:hypothetical protein
MKELFPVEKLERIAGEAEHHVNKMEEVIHRLKIIGDLGSEAADKCQRFLEEFKHNIQVADESRAIFAHTARWAIASPLRLTTMELKFVISMASCR